MKRTGFSLVILAILLSAAGVLLGRAQGFYVTETQNNESVNACDAFKIVLEIENYLLNSDGSLGNAVEVAERGGLWVARSPLEFYLPFERAEQFAEEGSKPALTRYFYGREGRQEFIAVLEKAGYEHPAGMWRTTAVWGTDQDLYQKKKDWKDPCSGGGGALVPQTTAFLSWLNLLYVLLGLIVLKLLSKVRTPIPART